MLAQDSDKICFYSRHSTFNIDSVDEEFVTVIRQLRKYLRANLHIREILPAIGDYPKFRFPSATTQVQDKSRFADSLDESGHPV